MKLKHRNPKLHLNFLLIILFLVPTFYSCKDDLPRETQDGRNTFGMLVDGEKWESPTLGYNPSATYFPNENSLIINSKNKYNNENTTLVINDIISSGFFNLSYRTDVEISIDSTRLMPGDEFQKSFLLSDERLSLINITKFDTVKKIVSGTFEAKLINKSKKVISLTEGRFDLDLIIAGE